MATQKRPLPFAQLARAETERTIEDIYNQDFVDRAFADINLPSTEELADLEAYSTALAGATAGQVLTASGPGVAGFASVSGGVIFEWVAQEQLYFNAPGASTIQIDLSARPAAQAVILTVGVLDNNLGTQPITVFLYPGTVPGAVNIATTPGVNTSNGYAQVIVPMTGNKFCFQQMSTIGADAFVGIYLTGFIR